jgi:hypothetical protein
MITYFINVISMSSTCITCSKKTNVWAHVSNYVSACTYCSYDCYKQTPCLVPTPSVPRALGHEPVILPFHKKIEVSPFIFLTDTELNDLSSTEYIQYNDELDDHCLLNPLKLEVHYTNLQNDKHMKSIEDKFISDSEDEVDDY